MSEDLTISSLVDHLTQLKAIYGDIPVVVGAEGQTPRFYRSLFGRPRILNTVRDEETELFYPQVEGDKVVCRLKCEEFGDDE